MSSLSYSRGLATDYIFVALVLGVIVLVILAITVFGLKVTGML
jgi:hypothetical protein